MGTLDEHAGSSWVGVYELWMDPLGHTAEEDACRVTVDEDGSALRWAWDREGETHLGSLQLRPDGGATLQDTFHSAQPTPCEPLPDPWALVDVHALYDAPEGPPWGWRTTVSVRPHDGSLVIQMDNVTPWGEHGRAVRMTLRPA